MNVFFNNFKIKRVENQLLSLMFAAAFYLNNRGEREESYLIDPFSHINHRKAQ